MRGVEALWSIQRYSSSGRGHWPLADAGSLSGMLNCYWPSAHPWSLGRLSGTPR